MLSKLYYDFSLGREHLTLVKAEGRTEEQARTYAIHIACDLGIWGSDAFEPPYMRRHKLLSADVTLITLGAPTAV